MILLPGVITQQNPTGEFLLLEDDTFLLLEEGDFLILEEEA